VSDTDFTVLCLIPVYESLAFLFFSRLKDYVMRFQLLLYLIGWKREIFRKPDF